MNQMNPTNPNPLPNDVVLSPPRPSYQQLNWDEEKRVKAVANDRMSGIFLLLVFLVCTLMSEAVFRSGLKIGTVVYFAAYTLLLYPFMLRGGAKLNWRAALLTLPIGLISLSYGLFDGNSTRFITLPVLLVLCALQIVYLVRPDKKVLLDFSNLRELLSVTLCKPFRYITAPFEVFSRKTGERKNPVLLYILLGVLLACPLLLLFLFLFASADDQFASLAGRVWSWVHTNLFSLFADILLGVLLTLFAAPLFIVCKAKMNNKPRGEKRPITLHTIILATALILLLLLVLLFSAIQFEQLFLSRSWKLYEYAQQARGGFFQMTLASALLFVIAACVIRLSKKSGDRLPFAISIPTFLLCCCNLLILWSAAARMLDYIDAAGLSQKRILTLWLMALLAFSTLVVIAKILWLSLHAVRWIGIATVCAVCLLSLLNIDRIVAEDHLARNTDQLDTYYLSELSCSAAPAVAKAYQETDNPELKEQLRCVLDNYQIALAHRENLFSYTLDQPEIQRALSVLQQTSSAD